MNTSTSIYTTLNEPSVNPYILFGRSIWSRLSQQTVFSIITDLSIIATNTDTDPDDYNEFDKLLIKLCKSRHDDHIPCIQFLIKSDKISPKGKYKSLICVCSNGWIKIFEMLLSADNGIKLCANNNKALVHASSNGHIEIVKLLLTYPNVSSNLGSDSNFALQMALSNGYYNIATMLLHHDLDHPIKYDTAVTLCLLNGRDCCMKLLLSDKRVDPAYNNGWILAQASKYKRIEIINLLLQDEKVRSTNPELALCETIENDNVEILRLLLDNFVIDINKYYDIALAKEKIHVVKFLKELVQQHKL